MRDVTGSGGALPSAPEVLGEIMPGLERRRRWSSDEKLKVLAQSIAPGSSPSLTCRMHGISSGQLYTWRGQFRRGELTGFVPVSLVPDAPPLPAPDASSAPPLVAGVIEVELPSGIRLRVSSDTDEALLRRVLAVLT